MRDGDHRSDMESLDFATSSPLFLLRKHRTEILHRIVLLSLDERLCQNKLSKTTSLDFWDRNTTYKIDRTPG